MFKMSACWKCLHSRWAPEDRSVGIFGPTLEDCDCDDPCPKGNTWEEYSDTYFTPTDEDLAELEAIMDSEIPEEI